MNRDDRIAKGLNRAGKADQARQDSLQRIEANRLKGLRQTVKYDPRLAVYGTDATPAQVEQFVRDNQQQ